PEEARRIARIVWERTESESLLRASAKMIGLNEDWHVAPWTEHPAGRKSICLVRVGTVEPWILHSAAVALEKKSGGPVTWRDARWQSGSPDRTGAALIAARVRQNLAWTHPAVQDMMRQLKIADSETASDLDTIKLAVALMGAAGRTEEAKNLMQAY